MYDIILLKIVTMKVMSVIARSNRKSSYQLINSFKMKYKKLTLGQIEALINKLGGEEEVRDFLSGKFAFQKQELEQKVRMLSKAKVFNFVSRANYQECATGKGILCLDTDFKTLFCSLIEDRFPEITENYFRENKSWKSAGENTLNETITTIVDVTPTRIAQEIFFIMQEKYPRSYKKYEWFFRNERRYRVTFSFLEKKGTLREIYLMRISVLSKD